MGDCGSSRQSADTEEVLASKRSAALARRRRKLDKKKNKKQAAAFFEAWRFNFEMSEAGEARRRAEGREASSGSDGDSR